MVENKPSAGSIVASQAVAKAVPDGHTPLLMSNGNAVAFTKANPSKLKVGTITPGSTQHLSAKLFETAADIDVLVVPY